MSILRLYILAEVMKKTGFFRLSFYRQMKEGKLKTVKLKRNGE